MKKRVWLFLLFVLSASPLVYAEGMDAGYPKNTMSQFRNWPTSWTSIDAAVNWGNGKVYFFRGAEYLRYDVSTYQVDQAPRLITSSWGRWPASFATGIDAAINWGNGKVYFFKGSQYIRYDIKADAMDAGYPQSIAPAWSGLPASFVAGIDAAVTYGNGKVYLFKGGQYVRYDMASDKVDAGYPQPIAGNWVGWPATWTAGIDDAVDLGTGKTYFFKGSDQLRYDKGYLGAQAASNIQHVIIISQENHSFDAYFGRYCTGAPGVTCISGRGCCERGPDTLPVLGMPGAFVKPFALNDLLGIGDNVVVDRDHSSSCELQEIHGGLMDGFVRSTVDTPVCGSPYNFAYADASVMAAYFGYADQYALADRYFQPIVGASASNDIYFATARWKFWDNDGVDAAGFIALCQKDPTKCLTGPTIGTLLSDAGIPWTVYAEGVNSLAYDSGDNPFAYFARPGFQDSLWTYLRDEYQFAHDIDHGLLPPVSYVKGQDSHSEHPGSSTIGAGEAFVSSVVNKVLSSAYANNTLILFTYDESGGFFDHVSPPPPVGLAYDNAGASQVPYGPRVPMLALGYFAKAGGISHTPMEHSSTVKFIEWNWLGKHTGQLHGRDVVVNNLGSLLDSTKTGVVVPAGATP